MSCIFERHPDIALEFHPKNQHLRSAYMNVLLNLIETMCQSTQELSKDDLADAYAALAYLTDAGMNLNWLEEKLEQVSEKKDNEEAGETRVQEIEEELKELKQKCSNLEAQLEKMYLLPELLYRSMMLFDRWLQIQVLSKQGFLVLAVLKVKTLEHK